MVSNDNRRACSISRPDITGFMSMFESTEEDLFKLENNQNWFILETQNQALSGAIKLRLLSWKKLKVIRKKVTQRTGWVTQKLDSPFNRYTKYTYDIGYKWVDPVLETEIKGRVRVRFKKQGGIITIYYWESDSPHYGLWRINPITVKELPLYMENATKRFEQILKS